MLVAERRAPELRFRPHLERMQTMLRAEVVSFAREIDCDRLVAVDLHAAHRVGRAATHRQPEQRREDGDPENVREELVVDLDGARSMS
jgi:hypothetical protein